VARLEKTLPPGAMVFQLPVVRFLGTVDRGEMKDYDPIISYLHSKTLRWSYGAVLGRYPSAWEDWIGRLPVRRKLEVICRSGFSGLTLDRKGYDEDSPSPESEIARLVGGTPIVSPDGRRVFFDLRRFAKRYPPPALTDLAGMRSTYPVLQTFQGGFVRGDDDTGETSRWCYVCGLLQVHVPPNRRVRAVKISMTLYTDYYEPSTIRIKGRDFHETVELTRRPLTYETTVAVAPGETTLRFDAVSGPAQEDPQKPAFRLENFRLMEIAPATQAAGP
jgi:phosphoglycerol transferase